MPELHPHQAEAVEKMHNGCILVGDVGTGKSITAVAYYMKQEAPKDVIVITTAKKRDSLDWDREFAAWGIGRHESSPLFGGRLEVDSWNNLHRYRNRTGCFFIFDEQRVVGSGKWTKDFLHVARGNAWILLSATPGDVWLDYVPVFVANEFYRNRTEFLNTHVVYNRFAKYPKVERYLGVSRLLRLRDQVLVTMPYDRHTIRHVVEIPVQYDQELFKQIWEKRWHVFEARPLRDVAELFLVARKVVNSDASRIQAVRQLAQSHPKLIVFYNFNYELESLRSLLSPEISLAEWNGHKHEPIPTSERWVYLVQYTAGSEGWNCTETNAMCFYSLTYSYKAWHQSHGRIDRLDTPFTNLYYYVLMSDSLIDKAIMRALKAKKSFNENRTLLGF